MNKKNVAVTIAAVMIACLSNVALADDETREFIPAFTLSREVTEDLEASQEKYLNKTLVVRGIVGRTYTSRYLTPNVELLGEGSKVTFVLPYSGVTRGMGQLSDFKPGQAVMMQGKAIAINKEVIVFKETVVLEK